jgi:hypothetical protein
VFSFISVYRSQLFYHGLSSVKNQNTLSSKCCSTSVLPRITVPFGRVGFEIDKCAAFLRCGA